MTATNVLVDKDKGIQVLINIVRNACEAIASGNIVKLQLYRQSTNLNQIYIHVYNGGKSIPEEIFPKLTIALLLDRIFWNWLMTCHCEAHF